MLSRRSVLATAAAGAAVSATAAAAASFGNPDEPPQGEVERQKSSEHHRSWAARPGDQQAVAISILPARDRRRQPGAGVVVV